MRIFRWASIGGLIGVLLGGVSGASLFLAPSTLLRDVPILALALHITVLLRLICSNAGAALGLRRSLQGLESTPPRSTAYDARRSGKTSDFRSPWLLLLPGALVLIVVTLPVLTMLEVIQPFAHWDWVITLCARNSILALIVACHHCASDCSLRVACKKHRAGSAGNL